VLCSIAIINGGKPFSLPTLRDLLQMQSYNHEAPESPASGEFLSDTPDASYVDDQTTSQNDAEKHSMVLPLQMDGDKQLFANEWRQSKISNVKRDYMDRLNEAHLQQRYFTASCDVCRANVSRLQSMGSNFN
jgi:hypothetical protein